MAPTRLLAVLVAFVCHLTPPIRTQVVWTPIYLDASSQVDLWTQNTTGCRCPYEPSRHDCACCVKSGGCHCGLAAPNRCAQCGLEQYCANMCNVTIDSRLVSSMSGKAFGQVKSPSIQGPAFCWYLLRPDANQRVELQVYRLVSVGRFNGTSCESGFLQLVDGAEPRPSPGDTQVCGSNERYDPPVVLFADQGPATLLFHVGEPTIRSQFLAYFSFTMKNGGQSTGFQPRGGRPLDHTVCDWLYQDILCREPGSCVLASPGYPGLYPPNRQCKYLITTSSIHTQVNIVFNTLLLPHNHCGTDYVAIYQGSTTSSPLLTTLCANKKATLSYSGPNLLLEFSSGPSVPPYNYNGFVATLEFVEKFITTEASSVITTQTTEPGIMMDGTSAPSRTTVQPSCSVLFLGNISRSGHFDTRGLPSAAAECSLSFHGRPTDIVHLSIFNYQLSAPSCQTVIEVYNGPIEHNIKPVTRICSPVVKHVRDRIGRFLQQQTYVSSTNQMGFVLRRSTGQRNITGEEFVDGAYLFHDEQVDGTLQPATLCDVDYYGLSGYKEGRIANPGAQHLFWNIEGPLRCTQRFITAANQSITISVTDLARLIPDPHCHTQCGDTGCQCVSDQLPLSQMDHLLILTEAGHTICCLCGDFQQEWLPVSVRSWSPVRVVYSVAHYTWTMKGFTFTANFTFHVDSVCGHHTLTQNSGELHSTTQPAVATMLNHFFYLDCSWLLDSKIERQVAVDVETTQNRPCTAWNISIHRYDGSTSDNIGAQVDKFCPRYGKKKYFLPWKMNVVLLRLRAMTRMLPEYAIRWHSQIVYANTRISGPTTAPAISECSTEGRYAWRWAALLVVWLLS